jgi:hypothetical protein
MPEFDELVRRIGHDEKLSEVFKIRLDDFRFAIHLADNHAGGL